MDIIITVRLKSLVPHQLSDYSGFYCQSSDRGSIERSAQQGA